MNKKQIILFLLISVVLTVRGSGNTEGDPVKIIHDTDICGDWDDVGAIAVLNALADLGEVEILGMCINTAGDAADWNDKVVDILNTYYGRPDIPIGVAEDGVWMNDLYGRWSVIDRGFYYDLDTVWKSTDLFRKLLAEQPDTSVVITSVGFLSNLYNLLKSEPDQYSDLDGAGLVAKKVKFLSCMAGGYPNGTAEANLQDWQGKAKFVIDNFPRPILFTSVQVGDFETGTPLLETPENNPVRAIYERGQELKYPDHIGHPSFDLVTVLVAARDVNQYFNPTVNGTNTITIAEDGEQFNQWYDTPDHGHRYFTHKNIAVVTNELNYLMTKTPDNVGPSAPYLQKIGYQTVQHDTLKVVFVSASDANNDKLKLTALGLPSFTTFDDYGDGTGALIIKPEPGDAGFYSVNLSVTDGTFNDSEFFTIEVVDPVSIEPNVVAHWDFDEGAGDVSMDVSGRGNNGILSGTPKWKTGKFGSALYFLNPYNHFKTETSKAFSTPEFSISMWVKWPDGLYNDWHTLLEYHRGSWDDAWYGIMTEGSKLNFVQHGASVPITVSPNTWYHIAVTLDKNGVGKTYFNGELIGFLDGNPLVIDDGFLTIGANNGDGPPDESSYESANATIDEVVFYSVVLDQEQIQTIYNEVPPNKYKLSVQAGSGGAVSPARTYSEGSSVSAVAIPDEGYKFSGWSGDVSGNTNPVKVIMDRDKSITANFIKAGTGISENKKDIFFKVYPNPSAGTTTLSYTLINKDTIKILVYDMLGKQIEILKQKVESPGNYSFVWNGEEYPDGVYIIKIQQGSRSAMKKIVIKR